MNILRYLWSWYNPSAIWEENETLVLTVDLDKKTFLGSAPGDSVDTLAFLGPGKVSPFGFYWPSKGIDVSVANGIIREIGFYFGHPAEPEHGAFFGNFRYAGSLTRLTKETTESEAKSRFGEPITREQDDEEILLYYDYPEQGVLLEFDLHHTLKYLGIYVRVRTDEEQGEA